MTPNEETKMAQMVCRYETIIENLKARLKPSRPYVFIKFRAFDIENKLMHDIAFPTWNGMVEVWENNIPQSKIEYLSIGGPEEQCILEQLIDGNWVKISDEKPFYNLSGTLPNPNGRP